MKRFTYPIFVLAIASFASCTKPAEDNCASVTSIVGAASASTVEIGQTLSLQANSVNGVSYKWKTPGGASFTTANASVENVDFSDEGWYHFEATNSCNQVKKDSFLVDVTMPQGSPSCAAAENSISFTAADHPASLFTTIFKGESEIPNDNYNMQASGGGNDMTISFHPSYNDENQPENGIYTTASFNANGYAVFGNTEVDKIFIVNITYRPNTIVYRSTANQKVYISRVNGKLKATVCGMAMQGSSNGTPYTSDLSFSVTEQ